MLTELDDLSRVELQLADECSQYYADPLGFVMWAFPWGEPGQLENEIGPDDNQTKVLAEIGRQVAEHAFDGSNPVDPIRVSESSGHGTGKSVMGAWIAWWILSTRPFSRGTATAGTFDQLKEKTWAAIQTWGKLCITQHWFDIQAKGVYHKKYAEDWKLTPQTCKEENAQSFAGQHARNSTSWYLFDEGSEVPDEIYKVAEGGLTDGEPMWFVWGQPVRNTGTFHRINFGDLSERWTRFHVDSRTSRFTNKTLLQQWIDDYGIDSDFVKVRVLGMPPSASELQFIDTKRIREAVNRKPGVMSDEPLVAGFDVSGGGAAWNVIRFRRGLDGNPPDLKPIRIPGEKDPDRAQRVGICAELLRDRRPGHVLAALFIDTAFGAAIAERLKDLGFTNVFEVNFGSASPDPHACNLRAYMYSKMKDWLLLGGIDDDRELTGQMAIPGYHINNSGKLVIESKESIQKRGEKSPDDADAFALTFSRAVALPRPAQTPAPRPVSPWG
jgi:hypothetical protein